MSDSNKSIAKSATSFLAGTLLSRFGGVVREMLLARFFGTHATYAAFVMAYRFASILRRIFGEGAIVNGFIPFFEEKRKESDEKAGLFFRDMFFTLIFLLFLSVAVIELILLYFYAYSSISLAKKEICLMTMIILPGLFFICLFGLTSALLQCEKHFFIPGVAPLFFNFTMILAIWVIKDLAIAKALVYLSWFVVGAYFVQLMMNMPYTLSFLWRSLAFKQWLKGRVFSTDVRAMMGPLLLGVVGVAAVQFNNFFDMIFARWNVAEGPAYLSYSSRLEQLPLSIFAIAIASALMPPLTRAAARNDTEGYRSMLKYCLARNALFLIPCTMVMMSLGVTAVNLIFGQGAFGVSSTVNTTICLFGYSLGLLPHGFVLILAPCFYSMKEYRIPTLAALYSVLINLVLNCLFVFGFGWGPFSVALATSIAALYNLSYLNTSIKKRFGFNPLRELIPLFSWVTPLALIAGGVTMWVGQHYLAIPTIDIYWKTEGFVFSRGFWRQIYEFLALMGVFSAIFVPPAWIVLWREKMESYAWKDHA